MQARRKIFQNEKKNNTLLCYNHKNSIYNLISWDFLITIYYDRKWVKSRRKKNLFYTPFLLSCYLF